MVEPLEEVVALGEVPCVDGVVMTAVLDIEYLAVLAQFVVWDAVAGPGVLHAIDEHHVAVGLLDAVEHLTNIGTVVVIEAPLGRVVRPTDGCLLGYREQVVHPVCCIDNRA